MWGSKNGARDYLEWAVLASLVVGSGCGLPVGSEGGESGESEAEATLLAAAEAAALWGLTNAPAEALAAAKAWEVEPGDCPGRAEEGAVLVLTGGCTTSGGVALSGEVRVNRVPDGGSWVFKGWEEQRGEELKAWSGNLSWVQTDGANNVTAYDFRASWPTAADSAVGGIYPYAGFLLDDQGLAISASGAARTFVDESLVDVELGGAWGWGGCGANPLSGASTWTAGEGEDITSVTASFDGRECEACVPWTSSGGESGAWCGG